MLLQDWWEWITVRRIKNNLYLKNCEGSVGPNIKQDQLKTYNDILDKAEEASNKGDVAGAEKWLDRADVMEASWKSGEEHPERIYTSGTTGEYEIKESNLAKRTEADAIAAKLAEDIGSLAKYKTMNIQDQAEPAEESVGIGIKVAQVNSERPKMVSTKFKIKLSARARNWCIRVAVLLSGFLVLLVFDILRIYPGDGGFVAVMSISLCAASFVGQEKLKLKFSILAVFSLLMLFAWTVWPTKYKDFIVNKRGYQVVIRVNRFTGDSEILDPIRIDRDQR